MVLTLDAKSNVLDRLAGSLRLQTLQDSTFSEVQLLQGNRVGDKDMQDARSQFPDATIVSNLWPHFRHQRRQHRFVRVYLSIPSASHQLVDDRAEATNSGSVLSLACPLPFRALRAFRSLRAYRSLGALAGSLGPKRGC